MSIIKTYPDHRFNKVMIRVYVLRIPLGEGCPLTMVIGRDNVKSLTSCAKRRTCSEKEGKETITC